MDALSINNSLNAVDDIISALTVQLEEFNYTQSWARDKYIEGQTPDAALALKEY